MLASYCRGMFASTFATLLWTTPVSADTFEPLKFMQDASVISAIATAVSQLSSCEENLVFSQAKKKDEDGNTVVVTVTCNKFPDEQGKIGHASVHVEMELDQDGNVGAPLGFSYE